MTTPKPYTAERTNGNAWVRKFKPLDECPPWAAGLLKQARKRAAKRVLRCTLDRASMAELVKAADGKCQVSGIPFDFTAVKGQRRRALCPSLDRIDSTKGYEQGNVRLVVYAVNAAMNEWGFNTLLTVARGVVAKHG